MRITRRADRVRACYHRGMTAEWLDHAKTWGFARDLLACVAAALDDDGILAGRPGSESRVR